MPGSSAAPTSGVGTQRTSEHLPAVPRPIAIDRATDRHCGMPRGFLPRGLSDICPHAGADRCIAACAGRCPTSLNSCGCSRPSGSGIRICNYGLLRGTQEIFDTLTKTPEGRCHRGLWRLPAPNETVKHHSLDTKNACKPRCSSPAVRQMAPRTCATSRWSSGLNNASGLTPAELPPEHAPQIAHLCAFTGYYGGTP